MPQCWCWCWCCGERRGVEKGGKGVKGLWRRRKCEKPRSVLTHASDTIENIERLRTVVEEVPCEEVLGVVVYDLPGRDCAAKASNGELKVGEIERYKTEFIDRESPRILPSPAPSRNSGVVKLGLRPTPFSSSPPPPPQRPQPRKKTTTDIDINSHCRDHQEQAQHGLRSRHRARLAPQPHHQHRPPDLPGQRRGLPRGRQVRSRAA